MFIKQLSIKNFRNYKNLILEFSPDINFITGYNAVGKTNIIEAIYVTSNIKSFRNISDTEITRWGENFYFCSSLIEESEFSKFDIGCVIGQKGIKKRAKIDGIAKKKMSDYYGRFLSVIFSPEDIGIIIGSPEVRRRFFDGVISKVNLNYLSNLSDFKKILTSRNRLLRDIRDNKRVSVSELDVWDKLYSDKVSFILERRQKFIEKYNLSFKEACVNMSGTDDSPDIEYEMSLSSYRKELILNELARLRNRDIRRGATGSGPHRDDYVFKTGDGILYKNCASQGQKRTAAISLRIAESGFIEKEKNEKPVILIDDIFSELDEKRKNRMIDLIKGKNQIIITGVNSAFIDAKKFLNVKKFFVEKGGAVKTL